MSFKTLLFLILHLLDYLYIQSSSRLISVFQINRHGARTPKAFEDLQKKLFFGAHDMQLTINGYRQEQLLGAFMKDKYIEQYKFLSPEYKEDEFLLICSPTQRTIFSATAFLSGLYPKNIIKFRYIDNSENEAGNLENILLGNKNDVDYRKDIVNARHNGTIISNVAFLAINMNKKNNFLKNKKAKIADDLSRDILNLKNMDSIPHLHRFFETEKKAASFLAIETTKKEIPLNIVNPLNDKLFHPKKCSYKGIKLGSYLENLKPFYEITEREILGALDYFQNLFNLSNITDFPEKKFKNKYDKLMALTKFYMSYRYHFQMTQKTRISPEIYSTFSKIIINFWYSLLNSSHNFEISLMSSGFFNEILSHFKEGIKSNNDGKIQYQKYKIFSGHDSIIVYMLISFLNKSYISENLQKALTDDNIFNFFVPEFGSYLTYELYYEEIEKYYYVKIIYNGLPIYDGLKIFNIPQEKDKHPDEINFDRFEELIASLVNKEYKNLDCHIK